MPPQSVVAHTSVEASRMTNDTAAEEVIPASAAASDHEGIEELFAVDPSSALSAATPDDSDEEETAGTSESQEAPLTKKQIHQSLYDQVMATVPEGRINQRVLDRLIGEWLSMTQIPLEQLQIFGRGSHRSIRGTGGGLTTVKRHGRSDRTFAPGEVKRLAEKVVDLAAQ